MPLYASYGKQVYYVSMEVYDLLCYISVAVSVASDLAVNVGRWGLREQDMQITSEGRAMVVKVTVISN